MRFKINLLNNHMKIEIEKQDASFQLELYELYTDQFLSTKEIYPAFRKNYLFFAFYVLL